MSDILCVTNRILCKEDFLQRIEKIAANKPKGMILREKDLSEKEYKELAEHILMICKKYDVPCMLHSFVDVAIELGAENIHLPLYILREMDEKKKEAFKQIGASCHSVEEAQEAEGLGCTYITAGHVFVTDCKKGLAPRGLE
ncbi:MAG: thiamine phosphate synthase, partial [Clostridia bacterium]|nr:thiamine phosphate synthase [Clostridia bacterium]